MNKQEFAVLHSSSGSDAYTRAFVSMITAVRQGEYRFETPFSTSPSITDARAFGVHVTMALDLFGLMQWACKQHLLLWCLHTGYRKREFGSIDLLWDFIVLGYDLC